MREENINQIVSKLLSGEGTLSFSSLKQFKNSPKDFIDYKLKEKKQTPAMIYGSMVHCLVLEPSEFESRYHALDDADICAQIGGTKPRATTKYKDWKEVALLEAGDRILVETDDYNNAKAVAYNVIENRASHKVLKIADQREYDVEWTFENFKFKGRIDGIGKNAIFDLKTCADAENTKFQRDIISMGYYLQAAMYRVAVAEPLPYYIIAVDKVGGVSVHQLDENLLEYGLLEYSNLLTKFNECILSESFNKSYDFWSPRYDGIFSVDKPSRFY